MSRKPSFISIIYFVIGILVASTHGYLVALAVPSNLIKALLAILLWPLVAILGVDIHGWF